MFLGSSLRCDVFGSFLKRRGNSQNFSPRSLGKIRSRPGRGYRGSTARWAASSHRPSRGEARYVVVEFAVCYDIESDPSFNTQAFYGLFLRITDLTPGSHHPLEPYSSSSSSAPIASISYFFISLRKYFRSISASRAAWEMLP